MMYYDPTGHELTKWDQAHLSKDEQKKILEYSLQWSHADKMLKSATYTAVISAYENAKEVAHDKAEEIRNKYRTEREYGEDNGHTTYVTENGTVYKDSPASYYYIKNYLSNSASKGTGNGSYTYKDKDGNTVTKQWTITNEEFLDSNALTQTEITEITKKKNPGLVDRGFDKAIYEYAQKKGINPKVILATLAQEQNWCRNGKYDKAFGVGPGGNPSAFAENETGGVASSVNIFLNLFNEGLKEQNNGGLKPMHVNNDYKQNGVWMETDAAARRDYHISGAEWMKRNPKYAEYLKKGIYVQPVNAAMYAKLKYTPWVDFPVQNSHPLQEWHDLFRSF